MKSKGSPNLYEILKSSSGRMRPEGPEPVRVQPPAPPVPVEIEEPAVEEKPEPPPPPASAAEAGRFGVALPRPRVTIVPAQPPATPPLPAVGPGERRLTISYNTAAFLVLVGLGMIFVSYSLGVRKGRGEAPPPAAERTGSEEVADTSPTGDPAPQDRWAIHLMEWKADSPREKVPAEANAQKLKELLAERNLRDAWFQPVKRGNGERLVLYYGRYSMRDEKAAAEDLAKLQEFRLRRNNGTTYRPFELAAPVLLEKE